METILLISASSAMESRLGDLLGSPRNIARISSWSEAFRLLAEEHPIAIVVGPRLGSSDQAQHLAKLDQLLTQSDRPCPLFIVAANPQAAKGWASIFTSLERIFAIPDQSADWNAIVQALQPLLESAAAEPSPSAPTSDASTIDVSLPPIHRGSLEEITPGRLLYALSRRQPTGILTIQSDKISRRFAIVDGQFAESPAHHDADALTSTFAWKRGRYTFNAQPLSATNTTDLMSLTAAGLKLHRPQRRLMQALTPHFHDYPTTTQLTDVLRSKVDWSILGDFLDQCTGQSTLEQVFSSLGAQVNEAFRAAALCRDTDAIHFSDTPTTSSVTITYGRSQDAPNNQNSEPQTQRPSKASRVDDEPANLKRELSDFYERLTDQSDHEALGLWEGCGREAVKEAYYDLVKKHHPDVYGGNVDRDIRRLAQKIFVAIRKAYSRLLNEEEEQTVPPPDSTSSQRAHQQANRKPRQTLRPGQLNSPVDGGDKASSPKRQSHSTPIAMGREPTAPHPSIDKQQAAKKQAAKQQTSKPTKTTPAKPSRSKPQRSTPSSSRRHSSHGIGDQASDPEWRKKQLERLQKKRTSSRPRSTTRPGSTPSSDPTRQTFNLGYKQFRDQRFKKAFPHLEKAYQKDPKNPLYATFYAYCLFQTDASKAQQAREILENALEAKDRQSLPDTHLFLGHILKALGKEKRAYRHFKKVRNLNPSNREAEREIRLYEKRHDSDTSGKKQKKGFFNKLFKK